MPSLEDVMEDNEAPHGVRAKAAEAVLDRTGYGKGMDIRIDASVEIKDPTAVLRERLAGLRDAQMEAASRMALEAQQSIIDAEVVEEPDSAS